MVEEEEDIVLRMDLVLPAPVALATRQRAEAGLLAIVAAVDNPETDTVEDMPVERGLNILVGDSNPMEVAFLVDIVLVVQNTSG